MVEPEIGEDFLELPLAVHRTQDLGLGELDDERVRRLPERVADRRVRRLGFCSAGLPLALPPRFDRRQLDAFGDLPGAHPDCRQPREALGHRPIGDALGVKLVVDEALEPGCTNLLDVAGTRPVSDAIQDVDDGLVARGRRRGGGERHAGVQAGSNCRGDDKSSQHCPG